MKKIILHSGGMDSLALILKYYDSYGPDSLISLGFNYGQLNFHEENKAAYAICDKFSIKRKIIELPLNQIVDSPLISGSDKEVANDVQDTKNNVIHLRNGIFIMFAASLASTEGCDEIAIGACREDYVNFRDCRNIFYNMMNMAIQAGLTTPIKGKDDFRDDLYHISPYDMGIGNKLRSAKYEFDITIKTPFTHLSKKDIMNNTLLLRGVEIYKYSYSCYRGGELSCGECTTCKDRLSTFERMGMIDPIKYKENK